MTPNPHRFRVARRAALLSLAAVILLPVQPTAGQEPPAALAAPDREPADTPAAAEPQREAPAAAPTAGDDGGLRLLEVPRPELEALEPAVADQLRQVRAALDTLLQRAFAEGGPRVSPAELAEGYGEVGRAYHAYELTAPAEASYRNAASIAEQDPRWPHLLGRLLQQAGRPQEAEAAYRRALELDPDDLPVLLYLAELESVQGQAEEAAELYRRALEVNPDSPAALAGLGRAALEAGDAERAVSLLERALAAVPQATRLHYPLGLAHRAAGNEERAREHLLAAGQVGVKPSDPLVEGLEELKSGERVHLLRGHMAFRAGHYADAANAYHRALDEAPDSAPAHVDLATALASLGYTEGAEEHLRRALALDPDSVTAHYNLGTVLLSGGEIAGGLLHLRRALSLDPEDASSHLQLARGLVASGDLETAREHFRRARELGLLSEGGALAETDLLLRLGDYPAVLEVLESARSAHPSSVPLLHAMARVRAGIPDPALRDGEEAFDLAERAYAAQRSVAHAETVAMALAELGRCEEAAEWQTKAANAAEEAGAGGIAESLRDDLERYAGGAPCRPPTTEDAAAAVAPAD